MDNSQLTLPEDRFDPISFLIESIHDLKEVGFIDIDEYAYLSMQKDPYLKEENDNIWTREQHQADGKLTPPLSYKLQQIKCDLWAVMWIKYDNHTYNYSITMKWPAIHIQ